MVNQVKGSDKGYEMFFRDVCGMKGNRLLFPVIITEDGKEFTHREVVQKGLEVHTRFPWKRRLLELRYYLTGSDYIRDPSILFKLRPLEEIREIGDYENVRSRDIQEALEQIRQSGVFALFQTFIVPTPDQIANLRAEHRSLEREVRKKSKAYDTLQKECEQLHAQIEQLAEKRGEELSELGSLLDENGVLQEKLSFALEELNRLKNSSVLHFARMKLQKRLATSL